MSITEGQLISDGTAVWKVKKIGNGELPAGTMQMFAGNTIPAGWLLCDGSAVSRTDYAKLFSAIGTIYGAGDGNTTFSLPNLVGRFVEGAATAGTVKQAGLPNITGSFYTRMYSNEATGVFQQSGTVIWAPGAEISAGEHPPLVTFDASRSNPIYGSSATVQPPALTMLPIIKY